MVNFCKMPRSFGYAIEGLETLFRQENNARFHLVVAIVVVIAAIFFKLNPIEWVFIVLVIGGVLAMEAFNTALEKLCDMVMPEFHLQVKAIKDLAAAGVLLMAIVAVVVGGVIFGQKLMMLI